MLYSHHHYLMQNVFITPERNTNSHAPLPSPILSHLLNPLSVSVNLPIWYISCM